MNLKDRIKRLQRAVNVDDDGKIGKETIGAFEDRILPKAEVVGTAKTPPWLERAYSYLGEKEIRGSRHNPKVVGLWKDIKIPWVRDDEIAWCAAFAGAALEQAGFVSTRKANARSYKDWGIKLDKPVVGAIITFWRGKPKGWKGHVGFIVGKDKQGRLLVIGGNQNNAVTIKAYKPKGMRGHRVLSYTWPKGYPKPTNYDLPLGKAGLVRSEA